ncbi:hypothetical protein O6H91_15G035800 [Diphasiastrum complanatum]|uniref:Uncharacterized protein n=1 Tax=Diphasiastrum complanatum TaxID=34168 RepID=A0ACC2BHI6_DIPCM|nr:hypothetical protein O6H91_15G035800 [Diphasiastrum complanatum]
MICLSVYYGLKVFSSALVLWNLLLFVEALETTRDIKVEKVQVSVNGDRSIATVSENFICATLDWWPPEKCDYGTCSWGHSSLLNLDLRNSILQNAVKGLSPLLLRLGGSLQDQVIYNVGNIQRPCGTFFSAAGLFGFSEGCINMSRWQDLNEFFYLTGSQVAFGLNALYGREQDTSLRWDSSNTQSFIQYTADNLYPVYAWELGNELSSSGVGASLSISQYAADIKELRIIIDRIYAGWTEKPLVVAPDGFFEKSWYAQFLQETGTQVLDACTHHIYNLGPGISTNVLDTRILDPDVLNNVVGTFDQLQQTIQTHGPWAQAWVGESGGAYNSGQHLVSDAFLSSFWYVDQLGMAACFNTQVYCRQSLVGGNYGLLNRTTFQPNPDYYSAFLWKELVGTQVLATNVIATPKLRAYAHCSKGDTIYIHHA